MQEYASSILPRIRKIHSRFSLPSLSLCHSQRVGVASALGRSACGGGVFLFVQILNLIFRIQVEGWDFRELPICVPRISVPHSGVDPRKAWSHPRSQVWHPPPRFDGFAGDEEHWLFRVSRLTLSVRLSSLKITSLGTRGPPRSSGCGTQHGTIARTVSAFGGKKTSSSSPSCRVPRSTVVDHSTWHNPGYCPFTKPLPPFLPSFFSLFFALGSLCWGDRDRGGDRLHRRPSPPPQLPPAPPGLHLRGAAGGSRVGRAPRRPRGGGPLHHHADHDRVIPRGQRGRDPVRSAG